MKNASLDRRGAVAAISAVVMVAVVGFAGLAIDVSRIWMLSARLKTAVDAASLIAARTMTTTTTNGQTTTTTNETATRQLFWANFHQNGWSNAYLGSTTATPTIEPISQTRIRVTATASLNTTLFGIISRQTTPLSETTVAEREGTGLELAIVFDQTASMTESKLSAAKAAVATMLNTLYGGADTRRNMFVSLVPFARTMNIGTGNSNFLNTTNMPTDWNLANWYGCVEARGGGQDITDISPATTAGQFRPYFDNSTYRRVGWVTTTTQQCTGSGRNQTCTTVQTSPTNAMVTDDPRNAPLWRATTAANAPPYAGAGACTASNAYTAITVALYASTSATSTTNYNVAFCRGDNDWTNPNGLSNNSNSGASYNAEYANILAVSGMEAAGTAANPNTSPLAAAGPNRLCARTPLTPLTRSRSAIVSAVNAIEAPARSGGTTVATGLQGGWYTLSPNWQNWWPGIATSDVYGTLPLAYNTRNMTKAVVILTDGDNNWQGTYSSNVRTAPSGTDLLYNAYGRILTDAASRRPYSATNWNTLFPGSSISTVNQTNADTALDGRLAALCAAMKNSTSTNPADHRIRIYIVGFEIDGVSQGNATTIRNMLKACASSNAAPYYLEAPTSAQLESAFRQVGDSLSSLRMIE